MTEVRGKTNIACAGVTILRVVSDLECHLDRRRTVSLRQEFAELLPGTNVVLDLGSVVRVDPVGLGVLIAGIRRIHRSGGEVAMCRAATPVARILCAHGIDRLAPLEPTVESAARVLSPGVE